MALCQDLVIAAVILAKVATLPAQNMLPYMLKLVSAGFQLDYHAFSYVAMYQKKPPLFPFLKQEINTHDRQEKVAPYTFTFFDKLSCTININTTLYKF